MSISALESSFSPLTSLYQSSLDSQLISSTTGATAADPSTSDLSAITGAAAGGSTSGLGNLASDLSALFKDLAQNNAAAAKTDLIRLQKDLGTTPSSSASNTASTATSTSASTAAVSSKTPAGSTPLEDLLSALSASLSTGNTSAALKSLVSYFVDNGNATGNLINTTA